ncbi:hypothetical protein ALP40_01956 [Pseudomonas viridiflava]|uniref:Uncharacterized protein n=1 Tax=Pseudomonas viridiflava TaxID=33069 RepID=A0A3M5P1T1_PSEVI|nr:hypothetical protein ALP40_01956 [Pseudomonas viridiflava]
MQKETGGVNAYVVIFFKHYIIVGQDRKNGAVTGWSLRH